MKHQIVSKDQIILTLSEKELGVIRAACEDVQEHQPMMAAFDTSQVCAGLQTATHEYYEQYDGEA